MDKDVYIIPIFVIGAARNGTTQVGNIIGSFEEVASVTHELHYGGCENALYALSKHWKGIDNLDKYIDFLFNFSSSDYFKIAKGNIEYHLKHRANNIYEFFFDLMDQYAIKTNKTFWVTKFDPAYFADAVARKEFLSYLNSRYAQIKYIVIQRNLAESLVSYLHMEGQRYEQRQNGINILPALILQAARYWNVYRVSRKELKSDALYLSFQDLIQQEKTASHIASFLKISGFKNKEPQNYKTNSSFITGERRVLSRGYLLFVRVLTFLFKKVPFLAIFIHKSYLQMSGAKNPIYRRVLKNIYFSGNLKDELKQTHSRGILDQIEKRN